MILKLNKLLRLLLLQKFKVNVLLAERKSRRLILSVKPKEKEELVEKKRKLMVRIFNDYTHSSYVTSIGMTLAFLL